MQIFLEWFRWINKVETISKEIFNISNYNFPKNKDFIFSYQEKIIKKIIWNFKFYNKKKDCDVCAQIFYDEIFSLLIEEMDFSRKKICIVPVPGDPFRALMKGFWHMEKICKLISKINKKVFVYKKIVYRKHKKRQVGLNKKERLKNLEKVFYIKKEEKIASEKFFLLDDILTTGTTSKRCLEILEKKNKFFYFLAFASNKKISDFCNHY